MKTDLIVIEEKPIIPEEWNYDNSVIKFRNLFKKVREEGKKALLEFYIAYKILTEDSKKKIGRKYPDKNFKIYCEDIGIDKMTGYNWLHRYFGLPLGIVKISTIPQLFLYNIWNIPSGDNKEFYGHFPERFMYNLLYYHTEENDLIYDPFAGSGTTIDICNKMNRRYICSDIKPYRPDILEWNILKGLPKDLPRPNLVFLDPPYWKQAEGKYSDSPDDLANMSLENFYSTIENILKMLMTKNPDKIAIVISPTQYPNENHEYEDHIFEFNKMISDKYRIKMRYILPYSTEQYNGNQVNIMKEEKKVLSLIRDLVVWERKYDKTKTF